MNKTKYKLIKYLYVTGLIILIGSGCSDDDPKPIVKNPDNAEIVSVDRFSDLAGNLMKRSDDAKLPLANEAIDFDQGDFITQSYGPDGQVVKYYNFDIQPLYPAPLYVLYRIDSEDPVQGQLNIINAIPGDIGYSDFWIVYKVRVPKNYIANAVASFESIIDKGFTIEKTNELVNCPVVPYGSTADLRLANESSTLDRGWYKNKIAYYFNFMEKDIEVNQVGLTPLSPIYVTFNTNPDALDPNSGPPSGFVMEPGSLQTHNVIATVPSDMDYSPLWSVYVYDNADFNDVSDLASAEASNILAQAVMYVNCPVVYEE